MCIVVLPQVSGIYLCRMNYLTSYKTVICIVNPQQNSTLFSSPKGMYKFYLPKYFGTFAVVIDCAVVEFQKHWLINCNNIT